MSEGPSDDETLAIGSDMSVEQLKHENKMKEIALSKATNLIELLNIEVADRQFSFKSKRTANNKTYICYKRN